MLSLIILKYLVCMSQFRIFAVLELRDKIGLSELQLLRIIQPRIQRVTAKICQFFIFKIQQDESPMFKIYIAVKLVKLRLFLWKLTNSFDIQYQAAIHIISMGNEASQVVPEPNFELATKFIKKKLKQKKLVDTFQQSMRDEIKIRMLGCMFGSIIGDVLGAFCQFQNTIISNKKLNQTMRMQGGGVFNLYKGQFTDDSELAYHLLKALTTFQADIPFSNQKTKLLLQISHQYVKWLYSRPFDIGITCRKGIQAIEAQRLNENIDINAILQKVKQINSQSQSNGSLMRIAPMPIFLSLIKQDPMDNRQFIENEIALIHSNGVLRLAGLIWVKVIYDLINRQDSKKQTFRRIFQEAQKITENEEIKFWFKQAKSQQKMGAVQKMGWAKIAWTYGMNILYKKGEDNNRQEDVSNSYFQIIKQVIRQGGDSDTNAAIVGGLLGAILGFDNLPYNYLQNIFNLQFPLKQIKSTDRPKEYEPLNVLKQLLKLMYVCQKQKNIQKQKPPVSPRSNVTNQQKSIQQKPPVSPRSNTSKL